MKQINYHRLPGLVKKERIYGDIRQNGDVVPFKGCPYCAPFPCSTKKDGEFLWCDRFVCLDYEKNLGIIICEKK